MTTTFDQTRMRMRSNQQASAQSEQAYETQTQRNPTMSTISPFQLQTSQSNTAGWVTFTYASFGMAIAMSALGVWALPGDLWVKGYLMMSAVFLCGSTFTLAKTTRDEHEARRFANRIEEAKTEKLLMEINRN